jgi:hypothetical protein
VDSRSRLLVDKVIKQATIPGNNCCHAGKPGIAQNCGFPHIWEIDFVQNTLFFENEELQAICEIWLIRKSFANKSKTATKIASLHTENTMRISALNGRNIHQLSAF